MKTKILVLILSVATSLSCAQTKTIHFETDSFAVIKAKAEKENKLIFIDAFTSWCSPCKWMAKNIFTNDTVADYFNSNFINAQIDMEKGEGIEIAKLYEVYCYPNLLFIDGNGNLVHRGAGALDVKSFIQLAENAQNPEKRFSKYKSEYESKKTDPAFLYQYLYVVSRTCLPYKDIVLDYLKTQKEVELTSRTNWNVIRNFLSDYKSREFNYLITHKEVFDKLYTSDSVSTKIGNVMLHNGYSIFNSPDFKEAELDSYKNELKKMNFSEIDKVLFRLDIVLFERTENWKEYIDLVNEKGDKYITNDMEINNVSWNLYAHSDNVNILQKAATKMKSVLEKKENQNWYVYDTYASLLYKLKKKDEAKTIAEKAIELAKTAGIDEDEYKSTRDLLEKIEKMN